jgi:hypothetical protein
MQVHTGLYGTVRNCVGHTIHLQNSVGCGMRCGCRAQTSLVPLMCCSVGQWQQASPVTLCGGAGRLDSHAVSIWISIWIWPPLQVSLYADYDYPQLLPFLRKSNYYNLDMVCAC